MNEATKRNTSQLTTHTKPALLAAGGVCAILATPAMAVELGEIQLQSALGQPLRASVAFALAPNEKLNDQCVYLNAAAPGQGLPTVSRATATISGQRIMLRGNIPLREPMMSLQLAVNCPYTAKVRREYLLLLSPPSAQDSAAVETAAATATTATTAATAAPAATAASNAATQAAERRPVNTYSPERTTVQRAPVSTAPVEAGGEYRVLVGDTLSEIAARIPDRKVGLWNAVNSIHAANPQAFLNGDVNRLIAGSTLRIPSAVTGSGRVADSVTTVSPAATASAASSQYAGVNEAPSLPATSEIAPAEPTAATPAADAAVETATVPVEQSPFVTVDQAPEETVEATPDVAQAVTETPADSAAPTTTATDTPAVAAPAPVATIGIPDTTIQQPVPVSASEEDAAGSSWLVWLGGAGVAIFLALLLFGRRLREMFGDSESVGNEAHGAALDETQISDAVLGDLGDSGAQAAVNLTDTLGRANALKVDTDVGPAGAFDTGDDLDVALDYSFASSGDHSEELDFIVDEDPTQETELPTRVMPTAKDSGADAGDDNYDVSMVLDVTKQDFTVPNRPASDLQAIEVESVENGPKKGRALDLTTEFDYRILEQDYEDELTATQALSSDIEEAVRSLNLDKRRTEADANQMSMAEDLDATAEITAEMPARALDDSVETVDVDADETDLTAALAASMEELEFDIDDDEETAILDLDSTANQPRSKTG